jgi:hypothetical protein
MFALLLLIPLLLLSAKAMLTVWIWQLPADSVHAVSAESRTLAESSS